MAKKSSISEVVIDQDGEHVVTETLGSGVPSEAGQPDAASVEASLPVPVSDDQVRADNGVVLRIKKRVLMPSLDFPIGSAIVVRIMTGLVKGKQATEPKPGKVVMEPGFFCHVRALNGQMRVLWTPSVLARTLTDEYPNESYVGGWFYIVHLPMKVSKDGAKYHSFSIDEIDPPTDDQMQAAAVKTLAA